MNKLLSFGVLLASALLASCGGGDDNTITDPGGGGGGGGTVTVEMGSGTPGAFTAGQIAIAVPSLAAGGSTSLTVSLVTSENTLFTESVDITFSSVCIAGGLATVTANPANTTTGIASATYAASGCSGSDVITATATVNGVQLSATGTVTVAGAAVGSIQFISATPEKIGLQGTGGVGLPETSTVIFRVVDSTGGPVAGAEVAFALDTSVGGITFTPPTATSGANGDVQTVVKSGTVATTVRVTATVTSVTPTIGTQSSQLVVTTGLPDQDSFSLAVQCPNVEAYNYDGVQNPVTVRLSDRFNNPVPDGTAVTFNAEGGNIAGSCTTTTTTDESGVCTVNWISANPRPGNGRVSVVATAIGEESFSDVNGNGVFDDPDSFDDLPEAFRDDNENDIHNGGEFFFDFDQDFAYSPGDGQFNGLLCQDTSGRCSANDKTGIGAQGLIIMSGSEAFIEHAVDDVDDANDVLDTPGTVTFNISDLRNQAMPEGTEIAITVSKGKIVGPSSYEVPCTTAQRPQLFYSFTIDKGSTPGAGFLSLTVTTPNDLVTTYTVDVND